jgi:fructose-bisphosphate aldolase class I
MKNTLKPEVLKDLMTTAQELVAKGKGILAADESTPTIGKRFESIKVESTEESRRSYRELLFTTPGIEEYISGVILFEETLKQKSEDGTPFPKLLAAKGIIPGIKVDKGLTPIPGTNGEKATQGLDGLNERLQEYKELGARFAKWRAVITISDHIPTSLCIEINAHALARYAAICQLNGIVPIVEPEVLMDGTHDITRCERVSEFTLHQVFKELTKQNVFLEGILLKPSMITSGKDHPDKADIKTVAESSLRCFRRTVPAAVPGLVFLSGGQSPELATGHLNAMNKNGNLPWELSFSYGRALQEKTLKTWAGKNENIDEAQKVFFHRARCNGAARLGEYSEKMESNPSVNIVAS